MRMHRNSDSDEIWAMTVMVRMDPNAGDAERIVVRLLRRYAACRQLGEQPLPPLTRLGHRLINRIQILAEASLTRAR